MRPIKIEMRDFMSWAGSHVIDFEDKSVVVLIGDTGAGKSSILDSILFVLYGETRVQNDLDAVIRRGAKSTTVAMLFDVGARRFRCERTRANAGTRRSVASLVELVDGQERAFGAQSVNGVTQSITDLVGLDLHTFLATVYMRQGDSSRFTADMTPAQRREMLASVLSLDIYENVHKVARERLRAAELAQAGAVRAVESIKQQLAELDFNIDVEDLENRERDLTRARQDILQNVSKHEHAWRAVHELSLATARLQEHASALVSLGDRIDNTVRKYDARKLTTIERHVREAEKKRADYERESAALQVAHSRLQEQSAQASAQITHAKQQIAQYEEALSKLKDGDGFCDVCGSPLDAQSVEHSRKHIQDSIASMSAQSASASAQADFLQSAVKDIQRRKALRDTENEESERRAQQAKQVMQDLQQVQAVRDAEHASIQAARHFDHFADGTNWQVASGEGNATSKLADIDAQLWDIQHQLSAAETVRQRGTELSAKLAEYEQEVTQSALKVSSWNLIAQAAHPGGVAMELFTNYVGVLAESCNQVAAQLDLDMSIRLEVEHTAKQPQVKIKVIAGDDPEARDYSSFSGGERFQIDLIVRLGMSNLLVEQSTTPIGLLVIDEGYDTLDPDRMDHVLGLLQRVSEHFGLVLTISHNPEVWEQLNANIMSIVKDSNGSRQLS